MLCDLDMLLVCVCVDKYICGSCFNYLIIICELLKIDILANEL